MANITKEKLNEKIAAYEQMKLQALAQANMAAGAAESLREMVALMDAPEPEPSAPVK